MSACPILLTVREAAERLHISTSRIYSAYGEGKLKGTKVVGQLRIPEPEITRVLRERKLVDDTYSVQDAAGKARVSLPSIRRWCRTKKFLCKKTPRGWRIYKESFHRFLTPESHCLLKTSLFLARGRGYYVSADAGIRSNDGKD